MAQISTWMNIWNLQGNTSLNVNNNSVTFFPMNFYESISLLTLFMPIRNNNTLGSVSLSLGLYSRTGGTLSIANIISQTYGKTNGNNWYMSATATSSAQNITPGTWWWGINFSRQNSSVSMNPFAVPVSVPANSFPGFYGGAMTVSTAALPNSVATSDLDVTFNDSTFDTPIIILTG